MQLTLTLRLADANTSENASRFHMFGLGRVEPWIYPHLGRLPGHSVLEDLILHICRGRLQYLVSGLTSKFAKDIRIIAQSKSRLHIEDPTPRTFMASSHGSVAHLLPQTYKRMISGWLEEDCPSFDYGGFVVGEANAKAYLLGKSPGMVAGVPFFDEVFRQLDCT